VPKAPPQPACRSRRALRERHVRALSTAAGAAEAVVADNDVALGVIERHGLHGKGIGFIDVHLLASVALTQGTRLLTRDKRLHAVAIGVGSAVHDPGTH
jgi:predicted nucleic acid-binding protein